MLETWVFDLDGCLVDSLSGSSLRPGAVELLAELRCSGHTIVLWSAGGAAYAEQRAETHGIHGSFDAFHDKDGRDADGRYTTSHVCADLVHVVFVDDRPEDMPRDAEVIVVSPYLASNPHDRGLAPAAARARTRAGAAHVPRVNG
jgi:phosphoglycolate phosphatase-like HAD superfamily hydrolase